MASCSSRNPAGVAERAANRRQRQQEQPRAQRTERTEAPTERSCRTTPTDRLSVPTESVVADADVVAG
ncbi:hypothetical protein ZHAS_00002976 [Anopheles sinensis]|uniref:Uncharacterized protein n=1 Tax=Anopheles sinensis TaxID=74873 RepID=A0A084VDE6_ANOSI|nr:hypothetical protein ZHAS_00002976 [Anopheles sinensis]